MFNKKTPVIDKNIIEEINQELQILCWKALTISLDVLLRNKSIVSFKEIEQFLNKI